MNVGIVRGLAGNFASLAHALRRLGATPVMVAAGSDFQTLDSLILPGVGAFSSAMRYLRESGLSMDIRRYAHEDRPLLGICLGAQLLFESGEENGPTEGLGILPGEVRSLRGRERNVKLPHTGWNRAEYRNSGGKVLSEELSGYYYFNHEYYFSPARTQMIAATTNYGGEFAVAVESGNTVAVQFHPEKSQSLGLKLLGRFTAPKGGRNA